MPPAQPLVTARTPHCPVGNSSAKWTPQGPGVMRSLTAVSSVSMAARSPALIAVKRFILVRGPSAYCAPPPPPPPAVAAVSSAPATTVASPSPSLSSSASLSTVAKLEALLLTGGPAFRNHSVRVPLPIQLPLAAVSLVLRCRWSVFSSLARVGMRAEGGEEGVGD